MSYFVYTAITPEGNVVNRKGEFVDELALLDELNQRGENLSEFQEFPSIVGKGAEFLNGTPKPLEIAEICNFLSLYIAGGLDISTSLADQEDAAKTPVIKKMLGEMRRSLMQGYSVSQAFERAGHFPELVVKMARIGEESGDMDRMLKDAAIHIERVEGIKSASKRALIYPLFTLTAMAGGFLFWMAYVVPKLVELFITMSVDLPLPTRILIAMSDVVAAYWWAFAASFIIIPFFIKYIRNYDGPRLMTDKWLWYMPVFGNMIQASQTAFYFQYLSLMYESGVVITKALESVRLALDNKYFAKRVEPIESSLRSGLPLMECFKQAEIFPPLGVRMVGIGEQTGKLDDQLTKLANMFFQKLHAQVEVLGKMLEPIIMGVVGVFFAFFAIALLGPLYDLISGVV